MSAIAYPIASTVEQALHAPQGFAAREREAALEADADAVFVTEPVGPAFTTEAALTEAFGAICRSDWCAIRPVAQEGSTPQPPVEPVSRDGRRWPEGTPRPVLWRLSVSYWRTGGDPGLAETVGPGRKLRRSAEGAGLNFHQLQALARQPMRAIKPQQPLSIGLFEVRLPEAPDRIVPDE